MAEMIRRQQEQLAELHAEVASQNRRMAELHREHRAELKHYVDLAAARNSAELAILNRPKRAAGGAKLQPKPLVDMPDGYTGPVVPVGL